MRFRNFIKDEMITVLLLLFGMFTIEIFLLIYKLPLFMRIYIPACILGLYFISIFIQYRNKKLFYDDVQKTLDNLDDKYLISEIMQTPKFSDGVILKDILRQTDKSMIENVNKYKFMQEDYKEYIELWIHEIKIPMSTSKLIIENNKNDVTKSIDEELDKLENYVEQALYYARSNHTEKDYFIKKINLKDVVNEAILKNKGNLISEKFTLDLHDLELDVRTDSKWVVFILNQILQNCIKYRGNEPKLEIYSKQGKEQTILFIKDNGIGIKDNEINRVFEKGFTGTNGRMTNKKSTGIGLYLCKKLCDKLRIGIEINSERNVGTEVKLIFPSESFTNLTEM